jgi:hypothetical protein
LGEPLAKTVPRRMWKCALSKACCTKSTKGLALESARL